MTEQEALRDLMTCEGWSLLADHVAADLNSRIAAILNPARITDPVELGQAVKSHQAQVAAARQWLEWPARRAAELDKRTGRDTGPAVVDKRGAI